MLVCYLDDSDAETSRVITIAGYVSDDAGWDRFEVAAEQVCNLFKVDVIHGNEFDRRKGCYKGWSVPKKIAFLHQLHDAMIGNVLFGISRSVPKDLYRIRKTQAALSPNLGAFGFAFGTVAFSLLNGDECGVRQVVAADGVAYRIETGHRNNGDISRYVEAEVAHGNMHPATTVTFVQKRDCRAIQLADLYAMYSRRRANRFFKTGGNLSFFPDDLQLHLQGAVPHFTGLVEDPVRSATNLRTGETFSISGFVSEV